MCLWQVLQGRRQLFCKHCIDGALYRNPPLPLSKAPSILQFPTTFKHTEFIIISISFHRNFCRVCIKLNLNCLSIEKTDQEAKIKIFQDLYGQSSCLESKKSCRASWIPAVARTSLMTQLLGYECANLCLAIVVGREQSTRGNSPTPQST